MPFTPIAPVPAGVDALTVPEGFRWVPVIRWGDPVLPGAPVFDPENQRPESQALQFGYNNDDTDVIADLSGTTGVLVTNHEYSNEQIVFPPTTDPERLAEQSRSMKMAQGMSVVEVVRDSVSSPWRATVGPRSRRITVETEFELIGRAANGALPRTAGDPTGRRVRGTLDNCAGGTTPWGTVLSARRTSTATSAPPSRAPRTRAVASPTARPRRAGSSRTCASSPSTATRTSRTAARTARTAGPSTRSTRRTPAPATATGTSSS